MSRLRHLPRIAALATTAVTGLLALTLLARRLPTGVLGSWLLLQTATTLFEMARSGLVQPALMYRAAGATRHVRAAWTLTAWAVGALASSIVAVLLMVGALIPSVPARASFAPLFPWLAAYTLLSLPASVATWRAQVERRAGRELVIRLAMSLPLPLAVLVTPGPWSLQWLVACTTIAVAFAALLAIALGWASPLPLRRVRVARVMAMWRFGRASVGTLIGTHLLRSSDLLMLGAWGGPLMVARYGVSQKLMEAAALPVRVAAGAAYPAMAQAGRERNRAQLLHSLRRWLGATTLLLLPAVLIAWYFAPELISLWRPDATHADATLLRAFLPYALLLPADRLVGIALDAAGTPAANARKVACMVLVNVAGNAIALAGFGSLIGVALASSAMTIVGIALGWRALHRAIAPAGA